MKPQSLRHGRNNTERIERQDSDDDILSLVDHGDPRNAFARLIARHGSAVYRYCRVALDDPALADDVQQQIFLEAYRDISRFPRRSTLRTWLFGIARHRVLDAAKMRGRRRDDPTSDKKFRTIIDPESRPDERLESDRTYRALAECIDSLSEPVRSAILLRFQQGFTYDEMSEILREKSGTLQVRVNRALAHLRKCLEARLGPELR